MQDKKNLNISSVYNTSSLTKEQEKLLKEYSKKMDDDIMNQIYKISKDYSYYDDYDNWNTRITKTKSSEEVVPKSLYNNAIKDRDAAKNEASDTRKLIDDLTTANVDMQRALIKIDPHNIRFIKNPYVEIQLEAIMADSTAFHKIINPSQEAIDAFGFIK